jgi:hypothetical protein
MQSGYAKFCSRSHHAVTRVYDEAGGAGIFADRAKRGRERAGALRNKSARQHISHFRMV